MRTAEAELLSYEELKLSGISRRKVFDPLLPEINFSATNRNYEAYNWK
ncbi:MAG: hypothetical protein IBX72_09935 [Nitrospirae bacterium]|nr:hypothetical protein [Nitrospirota bacterium]